MEYDIQQVLVSPGDMILVLLIQRVQEILPGQPTRDHAILDGKTSTGNYQFTLFNLLGTIVGFLVLQNQSVPGCIK